MANEEPTTFWKRLASGKLPSMDLNTSVAIDQGSLLAASAIIFVLVVLLTITIFTLKKRLA